MQTTIQQPVTASLVEACSNVYRKLGHGFSGEVYKDALEIELLQQQVSHQREVEQCIHYKGNVLKHRFIADFIVGNSMILLIDCCKDGMGEELVNRGFNYLKASGIRRALVVNFGKMLLEHQQLVY